MLATAENLNETKQVSSVLNVRYYIATDRTNDKVFLANGRGYFFSDWMRATEAAAKTLAAIIGKPAEQVGRVDFANGIRARQWLNLCGVDTLAKFDRLVNETLPLLRLPADSPKMARRCAKCGSRIWGREAILTGLGSECRRNGMAHKTTRRSTRRIAAMATIENRQ